jgi:hypothetical protein
MDNFIKVWQWEVAPSEYRLLAMEVGSIIILVPYGYEVIAENLTIEWYDIYQVIHMNGFDVWYGRE